MAAITFKYANTGPTGDTPTAGFLKISLLHRETTTGTIRTTQHFVVPLQDGRAAVNLTATSPDQAWKIVEAGQIAAAATRFVQVVGDANFIDLLDVDPKTLEPTTENLAGWQAALDEIRSRTVTATIDPENADLLILTYPAFMLDPDDPNILILPIGASA